MHCLAIIIHTILCFLPLSCVPVLCVSGGDPKMATAFLVFLCGASSFSSSEADGAFLLSRPTLSWTATSKAADRINLGRPSVGGVRGLHLSSSSSSSSSPDWNEHGEDDTLSSAWSTADNWNHLSSESSHNRVPDSDAILNKDLAQQAARAMEQGLLTNEQSQEPQVVNQKQSSENAWLKDALDHILTVTENDHDRNHDGDSGLLKMTQAQAEATNDDDGLHTETFIDDMGREIALLVRCNTSPQDLLIQEGRALAPLTDAQRNDVSQLVVRATKHEPNTNTGTNAWLMTDFFQQAVTAVFEKHVVTVGNDNDNNDDDDDGRLAVLDAAGVAAWMKQSLGAEEPGSIGPHDRRVTMTISSFGSYGSGYLDQNDFLKLYLAAVVGEAAKDGKNTKNGDKESPWRQLQFREFEITSVWRDLRNHGIASPVETMRAELMGQIESKYRDSHPGASDGNAMISHSTDTFMDECEILEESVVDDLLGRTRRRKSSYEQVELAFDNKTPLWIRDGDFIFIDEESCIGCTQCVSAAPSSFKMNDDGRAMTFSQRSSPDVASAVAVCPVDCMKRVSFRELKEFEIARDNGDGRSDHRHMGHAKTPLNVAGIDSDANHRSSWYHFLKNKCFMSKKCPEQACFDCPYVSEPGSNPHFKEHLKRAEHVRATHFIDNGMAGSYRKIVDL